jgi:hypothetical protein
MEWLSSPFYDFETYTLFMVLIVLQYFRKNKTTRSYCLLIFVKYRRFVLCEANILPLQKLYAYFFDPI